jgi:hypothetical protein
MKLASLTAGTLNEKGGALRQTNRRLRAIPRGDLPETARSSFKSRILCQNSIQDPIGDRAVQRTHVQHIPKDLITPYRMLHPRQILKDLLAHDWNRV